MTELITQTENSLSTVKELAKIVSIGREHLTAIRAELRAMKKADMAAEYRKQLLAAAQDEAENVLDAEVRLGEIFSETPKAKGGQPYQKKSTIDSSVDSKQKPKSEVITEAGFTQKQAERFQMLAKYPEYVEQAKAEAREKEDIVTRSAVLELIEKATNKPHVANNSGNNEWYTPEEYINLARNVMTEIDLDPASNETANKVVKAKTFYTEKEDGLTRDWKGKVWMNPPYSTGLIENFVDKFVEEYKSGNITEGIVLVNNATDTGWFKTLLAQTSAVCFPTGRIRFYGPDGETGTPLQGQALLYFGKAPKSFGKAFGVKGRCLYPE